MEGAMLRRLALVLCCTSAFLSGGAPSATAASTPMVIAEGHWLGSTWSIAIHARDELSCMKGTSSHNGVDRYSFSCTRFEAGLLWSIPSVVPIDGAEGGGILFLFLNRKVGYVDVIFSGKSTKRVRIDGVLVPREIGQSAGFNERIKTGTAPVRGRGCIRRVILYNHKGGVLERSPHFVCDHDH